jgi:hypothetical protein
MIKVANLVSLIAAPLIVRYPLMQDGSVNWVVGLLIVGLLGATVWAISQSNREAPTLQ